MHWRSRTLIKIYFEHVYECVFNIINYYWLSKECKSKSQDITSPVGGDVNWYSQYGKQHGGSSKNKK